MSRPIPWNVFLTVALAAATVTLFVQNVREYDSLGDDAFISFRYARNLVDGHGLVWNPGERVEGYTNFLWVLLMAAGMFVGIGPETASNAIGIASGVLVLLGLLHLGARRTSIRDPFVWIPVLLLATSRSFTAWCTGGLETMFFTCLVWWGFLELGVERRDQPGKRLLLSSCLLAMASLTRPDGILFAGVAGSFLLHDVIRRRRAARGLFLWCLPLTLPVAHFLWRRHYYGFWFPNTFYAKVSGAWWEQSSSYFSLFSDFYHVEWFLPLLALAVLRGPRRIPTLFLAVLTTYLAYVAYIGGDHFEFRFLVVVFPYFYWLLAEGVRTLAAFPVPTAWGRRAPAAVSFAVVATLWFTTWTGSKKRIVDGDRHHIADVQGIARYGRRRMKEGRALRRMIDEGRLPEDLVLCVGGAGALPYYTRWTTVDLRGLNDVYVAHLPLEERGRIAHERKAPYDYLEKRRVAVFDVFNKLLQPDLKRLRVKRQLHGRPVRVRGIRLEEESCLVFGTFVSDEELARLFEGHRILHWVEEDFPGAPQEVPLPPKALEPKKHRTDPVQRMRATKSFTGRRPRSSISTL